MTTTTMMTLDEQLAAAIDADDADALARIQAELDAADAATRQRLTAPGALLTAALYYARRSWPVFPCGAGRKLPAIANPHPKGSDEYANCKGECGLDGHGFYDATTDEDTIRRWWGRNPNYNIGIPTGETFDVVDIDGHTGMASLLDWCRETNTTTDQLFTPRLGSVLTPRRPGTHIYTTPTGAGNKAGIRPGIDFRSVGGYVLCPPSRTEHGMYVWATPIQEGAA
jgi:hypothetical protein